MFVDTLFSDPTTHGLSGWDAVVCEGGEITIDEVERDTALQNLMGSGATEVAAKWAESGRTQKKLEVMLAEGQLKGRDRTMVRRLLRLPAEPALSVTLKPLNVKLFNAQLKAKLTAQSEDSDEETEDEEAAEARGRTAEALFGRLAGIDIKETGETESCSGKTTPSSSGMMTPPPTVKRSTGSQAHVAERSDPSLDSRPAQKRPADVDSEPFSSINNSLAEHRQHQEERSIRPKPSKRRKVVDWLSNVDCSSAHSTDPVSPQDRDENQRPPSQSIQASFAPSLAAHCPTGSPVLQLLLQPMSTVLDHSAKINEDPTAKKARHCKFREGRLAIAERLRLARPDLPRPAHFTHVSGPGPKHGKKSEENRHCHSISKVDRSETIRQSDLQVSHSKELSIDSANIGEAL